MAVSNITRAVLLIAFGLICFVIGTLAHFEVHTKTGNLEFHVTHLNGVSVEHAVEMDAILIHPIPPYTKGRDEGVEGAWDWRIDPDGSVAPPNPRDGEEWELLGVQTGRFEQYASETWKEISGGIDPVPSCASGFYTPFEFIAVKKH
jgi:hypothetical protein